MSENMPMSQHELAQHILKRKEEQQIGLRRIEAESGVSFATISRFLRGGILTYQNHEKLQNWLCGTNTPKKNPVAVKRMKVGSKIFIVTIEQTN